MTDARSIILPKGIKKSSREYEGRKMRVNKSHAYRVDIIRWRKDIPVSIMKKRPPQYEGNGRFKFSFLL